MAINTWPYKAWATGSPYTHSQTHSTMPSPKKLFLKRETFISQLLKNKKWHSNISSPQTTDDAFECYNWNQQQFAHLTHKHYRFTMLYSDQIDNQSVFFFKLPEWIEWLWPISRRRPRQRQRSCMSEPHCFGLPAWTFLLLTFSIFLFKVED